MKKFIGLVGVFLVVAFVFYPLASVQAEGGLVPCGTSTKTDPCTLCHLIVGFHNLTKFFLKLLVVVSLAGITIAGVMYTISGGSEKMLTQAKSFLKSSLIGFVVVLGAWLIVNVTIHLLSANLNNLGITASWNEFKCEGGGTQGDVNVHGIANCDLEGRSCNPYTARIENWKMEEWTSTWTCANYDENNKLLSKADCSYTVPSCDTVKKCECFSGNPMNCSADETSWTCKTAEGEVNCPQ